jgi:uroporphyrinogen decarboxylase
MMTSRERILAAIEHRLPDRVPNGFEGFNRRAFELFRERTGSSDFLEYFKADYRVPRADSCRAAVRDTAVDDPHWNTQEVYRPYHGDLPEGARITEWGVGMIPGSNTAFDSVVSPLKNARTLAEFEAYPLPDLNADYRWAGLRQSNESLQGQGYATVGWMAKTIFEIAWAIRSFEGFLMDMAMNPDWAACLIGRICRLRCAQAARFAEAGIDILQLGDDVGSQDRMTISAASWRQWFKPRLHQIIEAARARNPIIKIFYHSDGYIEPIIDDLVEIGVDILNPVQPECMDLLRLKKRYGGNLCFWGTIGTQTTMPFGSTADVFRAVKDRIEIVGKGGGLILAPTHTIEEDVPWENLLAFFEALQKYGTY